MEVHILESRELLDTVISLVQSKKGRKLCVLEMTQLVYYTDWFVIVHGQNARHVRAIAEEVRAVLSRDHGEVPLSVEGEGSGRWLVVDYGDVVVHVFDPDARKRYDLEGLWADAPHLPVPTSPDDADDDAWGEPEDDAGPWGEDDDEEEPQPRLFTFVTDLS